MFAFGGLVFVIFAHGTLLTWENLTLSTDNVTKMSRDVADISSSVTANSTTKQNASTDDVNNFRLTDLGTAVVKSGEENSNKQTFTMVCSDVGPDTGKNCSAKMLFRNPLKRLRAVRKVNCELVR
jgi:hypothetical protein